MTNKELNDYVTMSAIMNEQNPEKRRHMVDTFCIMKATEKQRQQSIQKRPGRQ